MAQMKKSEARFEELLKELEIVGDIDIDDCDKYISIEFDNGYDASRDYEKPALVKELEMYFMDFEWDIYAEGELYGKKYLVDYASSNM